MLPAFCTATFILDFTIFLRTFPVFLRTFPGYSNFCVGWAVKK